MMETLHISAAKHPTCVHWLNANGADMEMLFSAEVALFIFVNTKPIVTNSVALIVMSPYKRQQ